MSNTHASASNVRRRLELARLVDASLYGGIALYAVVLYAGLGYAVYALVAWYLDARGIT